MGSIDIPPFLREKMKQNTQNNKPESSDNEEGMEVPDFLKKKEPDSQNLYSGQRPSSYPLQNGSQTQKSGFKPQLNLGESKQQQPIGNKVDPLTFVEDQMGIKKEDLAPHNIYNNASKFISNDLQNHPYLLKNSPYPDEFKKQIIKGDGDINIQRYTNQRVGEMEAQQDDLKSKITGEMFGLNPDKEKVNQYISQIGELEKQKDQFKINASELNDVQAVTNTPSPTDFKDATEYFRKVGMTVNKFNNPIAIAYQEKNIKDGTQGLRDPELVDLDNYKNEQAGIDAKKKQLDVALGNGEITPEDYKIQSNYVKVAQNKILSNNPGAKAVIDRNVISNIIEKNRNSSNIKPQDKSELFDFSKTKDIKPVDQRTISEASKTPKEIIGESGETAAPTTDNLFHDLIRYTPSDNEVKNAIKEARKQGYQIGEGDEWRLIADKDQIPGTSALGNLYQSTIGSTAEAINNYNPFLTPQDIESQKYQHESRLQPTQAQTEGVLGYVNNAVNTVGTVLKWATLGKLLGGAADAAVGGSVGAETVGGIDESLGGIRQLSEAQQHLAGTALTSGLLVYPEAKDEAKKFTSDESKQDAYAGTMTLLNTLAFTSLNPEGIVKGMVGKLGQSDFAEDFLKTINKSGGMKELTPETFKNTVYNGLKKAIGANASATATMTALDLANQATDVMFGKKPNIDMNEVSKNAVNSFVSFAPLSLMQGVVGSITDRNRRNTSIQMINEAAKDPISFSNYMNDAVKEGRINQKDANKKIQIVNTQASLRQSTELPKHLSEENKAKYIDNLRRELEIKESMNNLPDENLMAEKEKQIKVLQEERKNILNPPAPEEPKSEDVKTKPQPTKIKHVSGEDLKGKKIYSDFNSTIADKDNKLLPFGEEIKQRINNGEPITIVTKSEDKEGQPEGSNKKRMLDALGLKEQPENLKIIEGVTPEEKAELAKDGVLVDNSNSVKEAAEKSGTEFINANKYSGEKEETKNEVPKPTEEAGTTNETVGNAGKETEANPLAAEIKTKLKEVANGGDKEVVDYAIDKVSEAPTKLKNDLGEDLFNKVLEQTPTKKLQDGLDYLIKNNPDSKDVDVLDKIISDREKQQPTVNGKTYLSGGDEIKNYDWKNLKVNKGDLFRGVEDKDVLSAEIPMLSENPMVAVEYARAEKGAGKYIQMGNKFNEESKMQRYKLKDDAKILDTTKSIDEVNKIKRILGKPEVSESDYKWRGGWKVWGHFDHLTKEQVKKLKDSGYDAVKLDETDRDTGIGKVDGSSYAVINKDALIENPLKQPIPDKTVKGNAENKPTISKEQPNPNEKYYLPLIKKIKKYAADIIANRKKISRLSEQAEQGRRAGGIRNVEATILLSTGGDKSGKIEGREAQQKAVENYAKSEGIWFDKIEEEPAKGSEHNKLGTYIDSGVENQVYVPKENPLIVRKAMKTTDPLNKDNPNEVLDHLDTRISEHNGGIGSSVPYTVIGFGRLSNGDFAVITEQPHVQDARLATETEIQKEMGKMGYELDGRHAYGNDNYYITDVNPKNVLVDKKGNLHFIDTMIDPIYERNENGVPKEPISSQVEGKDQVELGKEKPEIKQGKYEAKARKIVEEANKKVNEKIPKWMINTDPTISKSGLDADYLFKKLGEATIEVGRLMDKGIEFAEAIKEGANKFIDDYKKGFFTDEAKKVNAKLTPDFENQLRKGFEQHYKENIPVEEKAAELPPEPPKEKIPEPESEEPKNLTAIRKEKQIEIEAVAKSYKEQKRKGWVESLKTGLEKIAKANPTKNLYDSAVSALNNLIHDNYGDLSRDEAASVMHYLKHETGVKRAELSKDINSDDDAVRKSAILQDDPLKDTYENAALQIKKIGTEAGRTLNYLQSELFDSENGLQIKRMDLLRASGGGKLSPEDEEFAKNNWEEEKQNLEKQNEAKVKSLQENFDKKLADLQKEFEAKSKNKATVTDKTTREKTLKQKGDEWANKILRAQIKTDKNTLQSNILGLPIAAYNALIKGIAETVRGGATIAEAIKKVIDSKEFPDLKEEELTQHLVEIATKKTPEETLQKIKDYIKEGGETDVTKEMVGKNLIKDYVDSHIGEVDQKDILDEATKGLKEVFPDIDKNKLIEAYLKEGDYKQDTKKDLQGGIKEQKKQLQNIAKLEEDLKDLHDYQKTRQRVFPTDREKSDYEKELSDKKEVQLKKLNEERRKVIRNERDLQKRKDKLAELDANIKRAQAGQDIIKTFKNKSDKEVNEEIESKTRQLKRAINDNTPEDKVQDKLLQKAKDNAIKKTKEFQRRIDENDYEEPEPKTLNKEDAELIKLKKEQSKVEGAFRAKQDELRQKNKGKFELVAELGRSVYVAYLLHRFLTLGKVAAASIVRPLVEGGTRMGFGTIFDGIFPDISKAAKMGGESSSWQASKLGYEAWFKQRGQRSIEKKAIQVERNFQIADRKYNDYKNSENPDADKLKNLKDKRDLRLKASFGNLAYQFIGSSSIKDALQAFIHRSNEIERQFGKVSSEGIQGKNELKQSDTFKTIGKKLGKQVVEGGMDLFTNYKKEEPLTKQVAIKLINDADYLLGFIGRSHSAVKTFSGRYSFASGFMARIEGAVDRNIELTPDKVLEFAHESYLDWERGKYQNPNQVSDWWSHTVNQMDKDPRFKTIGKIGKQAFKTEVAIQRVPVNILWEEVTQYAAGLVKVSGIFGGKASIPKLYRKTKAQLKDEGLFTNTPEFKEALKEKLSEIDPYQAALIYSSFRKGSLGIGIYATALILGGIHYGIFPHLGQKKKKPEDELKPDELNPGQLMVGNTKYSENVSALVSHTQFLWPTFMGLGIAQAYHDNIKKGQTTKEAAANSAYLHLNILIGNIPQFAPVQKVKEMIIDPIVKREIKESVGSKHQGFNKQDEKDSTLKYYWDKGVEFTPFNPNTVEIPNKGKLSGMPQEKWEEYRTQYKATLKEELDNLKGNTFYVTKDGKVHTQEPEEGDYDEKVLSQLTVAQLKKAIVPAEAKATKAAKEKLSQEN